MSAQERFAKRLVDLLLLSYPEVFCEFALVEGFGVRRSLRHPRGTGCRALASGGSGDPRVDF